MNDNKNKVFEETRGDGLLCISGKDGLDSSRSTPSILRDKRGRQAKWAQKVERQLDMFDCGLVRFLAFIFSIKYEVNSLAQ